MGLRPGGDKGANADSSSSVHPRNESSSSEEQGGRHYSFSTPLTSMAGSETRYDPLNLYFLISLLIEGFNLETPSSARKQMIPSLILLLLPPLIPPSRRQSIKRPNQATAPSKILEFATLLKKRRRQIRDVGIMQMGIKDTGTRQPPALQIFGIPPSAQRAMQV